MTTRFGPLLAAAFALAAATPAQAQTRAETLRYVTGGVVNTLDPVGLGATQEAVALGTSVYDRLFRFGRVPSGEGSFVSDFATIRAELAESHETSPDGLAITVRIRPGARWHDGSPVTAEDVKWSLDRAVSGPTLAKAQLATGSLLRPGQFAVVDLLTVRITLDRPDRLAIPNLATPYAPMVNSALARRHATASDPWATEWLRGNTAAGGAYIVQGFVPGQQVTLARNEGWSNGAKPGFARLVLQTVPEAATRANLVERGDADLTIGLQPEDLRALERNPSVKVVSTPMPTGFAALVFNTRLPPFDRPLVRQALALAIPYEAIFAAAGRGAKLFGAPWSGEPPTSGFPQALPLRTDLALARATLAEAGFPDGFDTTLTYGVGRATFGDPASALIQESFARIGVTVRIEKLPDAQMASAVTDKSLPMLIERSLALFPSTEYFFRVFLSGPSRWNFPSWDHPEVAGLLRQARHEPDPGRSDALSKRMIAILADQVPMATLFQPTLDVVTARSVRGFTTWHHSYPDLRDLSRQ